MAEVEGVIKYTLDYRELALREWAGFSELNAWRNILYGLHLIGQDRTRYGGLAYGNISCREDKASESFLISGTQTGGKPQLDVDDYCRVNYCDVRQNHLVAEGRVKPSSEALSHGMVYQLNPDIYCVIHVHNDVLWRLAGLMKLPSTDKSVAYGTVAMADEIESLYQRGDLNKDRLLVMGGHEDGVITYGETIEQAGSALITQLAKAIQNYK